MSLAFVTIWSNHFLQHQITCWIMLTPYIIGYSILIWLSIKHLWNIAMMSLITCYWEGTLSWWSTNNWACMNWNTWLRRTLTYCPKWSEGELKKRTSRRGSWQSIATILSAVLVKILLTMSSKKTSSWIVILTCSDWIWQATCTV